METASLAHEQSPNGAAVPLSARDNDATGTDPTTASGGGDVPVTDQLKFSTVLAYRSQAVEGMNFEYLDHTADIQVHSWGGTLGEALEGQALGMFNYMSELKFVNLDPACTRELLTSEGHDLHSMVFGFLDELLFTFHTENIIACKVEVLDIDRDHWRVRCRIGGELFDRQRHDIGTEVKAITYSAMQVLESEDNAEVFVILDI